MSLHLHSHPWQVLDLDHGIVVTITQRDLDAGTLDELFELARESGPTDLTLNFAEVKILPAGVAGKLLALDRRLWKAGGCLLMCGLDPAVKQSLYAAGWPGDPAPVSLSWGEPQDCFVVFVRDGIGAFSRPEAVERPVAAYSTYAEAVKLREQLRQSGQSCVIRFVGQTGGGD